jgi:hypothetical protein
MGQYEFGEYWQTAKASVSDQGHSENPCFKGVCMINPIYKTCWYCQSWGRCNGDCEAKTQPVFTDFQTPKGCICPPTSEQTCQRSDCGRKDFVIKTGVSTKSLLTEQDGPE